MSFKVQFDVAKADFTKIQLASHKKSYFGKSSVPISLDVTNVNHIVFAIDSGYDTAKRPHHIMPSRKATIPLYSTIATSIAAYFSGKPSPDWINFSAKLENWRKDLINKFKSIGYIMTVGEAQKIVNMAFKFMYCFDNASSYEDWFKYCHMPLDRYTKAWYENWFGQAMGLTAYKLPAWSTISSDLVYNEIQNNIHLYLSAKEPYGLLPLDNSSLKSEFIIWNFMR